MDNIVQIQVKKTGLNYVAKVLKDGTTIPGLVKKTKNYARESAKAAIISVKLEVLTLLTTNKVNFVINGKMDLLPPYLKNELNIPKIYETGGNKIADRIAYIKYFIGHLNYYVIEYEEDTQDFFCYVQNLNTPELSEFAYVNLRQLENTEISNSIINFYVERDLYFKPTKLKDII